MAEGNSFSEHDLAAEKQLSKNRLTTTTELLHGLTNREQYLLMEEIYEYYAAAIERRGREPLNQNSFENHFFNHGNYNESLAYGADKDGYLLGSSVDGVFVPTHFAPKTLRGGYRLMKELVDSPIPVSLFITKDLVDTVEKMPGWKVLPFHMTVPFRDQVVEKTMVVNRWEAIPKLALFFGKKAVSEKTNQIKAKFEDFGQRVKMLLSKDNANMAQESPFETTIRSFDPDEE